MMSIATFYPTQCGTLTATHTYRDALDVIRKRQDIHTTQMCLLNEAKEYDVIRIVESPDDVITIVNNHDGTYDCERTDKCLRYAHNFFKMWEAGVFDLWDE